MKSSYKVALIAGVLLLAVVVIYFNRPAGHDVREGSDGDPGTVGSTTSASARSTAASGETRWAAGAGSGTSRTGAYGSGTSAPTHSSFPPRSASGEAPPPSDMFAPGTADRAGV